jgi:N-acetylglucosamine-6-sulfatase
MDLGSRQAWRLARLAVAAFLLAGLLAPTQNAFGEPSPTRPSIVLIVTDDEDLAAHTAMSKTRTLLAEQGTTFSNYFVTYSFCRPSRATILRGQYPHNHNVEGNVWPTGGLEKFRLLGLETSTIATWLNGAGYHTAIVGKYLNGYRAKMHPPAPGWDEWFVPGNAYYNYDANKNGEISFFASAASDYQTDVLAHQAIEVIRHAAAVGQPIFLYLSPYAPHSPATPAPRHARTDEDATLPRPPSFNEPDVSDKPSSIRERPQLTPERAGALEAYHRKRVRSLRAVDDMVERVVKALQETGRLATTYVIYTSDNGFHMGQHRIARHKTTAYEEDIRVPLIVRGPGVPVGQRIEQMVINNDLAPTLAAMAGIEAPSYVDGRSFLPLLADSGLPWRRSFLVERRETERHELTGAAVFDAIRTSDWTYVEYGNGERELYDLHQDPFQLDNRVATADPALLTALSFRLAELRSCASTNCRELENRPVELAPSVVTAK